jgi:hypothetical protein
VLLKEYLTKRRKKMSYVKCPVDRKIWACNKGGTTRFCYKCERICEYKEKVHDGCWVEGKHVIDFKCPNHN